MNINFKLGSTTGKAGILSIECQKLNIPCVIVVFRNVLNYPNSVQIFKLKSKPKDESAEIKAVEEICKVADKYAITLVMNLALRNRQHLIETFAKFGFKTKKSWLGNCPELIREHHSLD